MRCGNFTASIIILSLCFYPFFPLCYTYLMEKRYNAYSEFLKQKFGAKVYKITLDAGFSCPNRDGTISNCGCIFCDDGGSFSQAHSNRLSIEEQVKVGAETLKNRFKAQKFMSYFQAFSNTYKPVQELEKIYTASLNHPDVVGLSIGTRPDCVDDKMLDYFARLGEQCYVMLEYGVESTLDRTLERINRGHTYAESEWAIRETAKRGIHTGAHIILGLPGESDDDCLSHADRLNELPLDMLKLHQLQIVNGTTLARQWLEDPTIVKLYTMDEYIDLCVRFLQRLKPEIGIERFISQSPKDMLLAPDWGVKNYEFVDKLRAKLRAMKK